MPSASDPQSIKAGRYGLGHSTFGTLREHGYRIDTSAVLTRISPLQEGPISRGSRRARS